VNTVVVRPQVTVLSAKEYSIKFRLTVYTNNNPGKNNFNLYRFNVSLTQHELFCLSKDNNRHPTQIRFMIGTDRLKAV